MQKKKELAMKHHLGSSDGGHYALMKLDIPKSKSTVYDSLQSNFEDSEYFPAKAIKQIVTEIYVFFRSEQGYANRLLQFDQIKFQPQFGNDCGPNMLVNAELIVSGLDPALQHFTEAVMQKVRYYHALLYSDDTKTLRLGFSK